MKLYFIIFMNKNEGYAIDLQEKLSIFAAYFELFIIEKSFLNMIYQRIKLLLALSTFLGISAGCSHNHEGHHHGVADEHIEDEHAHSSDDIVLSPEKAEAAGVVVAESKRGIFHNVIVTSGSLQAASCDETTIVATVSGVVSHAQHISEGMSVNSGTTLYYVSSNKLQDGDQAKRMEIAYLAAKREYERALPLVEEQIISQKDFTSIKSEYENAKLAYEAIGKNATQKGVAVKSPITGYIKDCQVTDGDFVNVGDPLMVLTRNQHLYLRAEVPVRYYSALSHISSAKFRTQYSEQVFDLESMNGELMSSGKSAVGTSSYVPVTFKLDNKGDIVPGSYAEVFLVTGERDNVLSLPASALTEEQGVYYVYIQEDEHTYHKREVVLGDTDGELTEIVSGLNEGEHVVTKGAINVKLAAATNAIPAHTHSH